MCSSRPSGSFSAEVRVASAGVMVYPTKGGNGGVRCTWTARHGRKASYRSMHVAFVDGGDYLRELDKESGVKY